MFDTYLQELGLGPVGELPSIRIDEELPNAYYNASQHEIVLGRITVENRYLLFRLYGMHVLTELKPEAMADHTDTGLVRGLADFLAASFLGDAAYRHTPRMRHLHNEGRLDELAPPEDGTYWDPAYEAGEVWGGALWELRRFIGAPRAPGILVSYRRMTQPEASEPRLASLLPSRRCSCAPLLEERMPLRKNPTEEVGWVDARVAPLEPA